MSVCLKNRRKYVFFYKLGENKAIINKIKRLQQTVGAKKETF